jgi:hypothetical protein
MREVEGLHAQLNDALNRNHETFHQLGFVEVISTGIVKTTLEYSIISSLLQKNRAFSTSRILDAGSHPVIN